MLCGMQLAGCTGPAASPSASQNGVVPSASEDNNKIQISPVTEYVQQPMSAIIHICGGETVLRLWPAALNSIFKQATTVWLLSLPRAG